MAEEAQISIESLKEGHRDTKGRFEKGNFAALKDGLRSRLITDEAAPQMQGRHKERAEEIKQAIPSRSVMRDSLIDTFARLEIIEESLGENVIKLGSLTGKGRTRAAVSTLFSVVDRKIRLAGMIVSGRSALDSDEQVEAGEWKAAKSALTKTNKVLKNPHEV